MADRREKNDAIDVSGLSREAWEALDRLSFERDWPELTRNWWQPENMLLLIERLKGLDDMPERFPHGKWATIQHLQELFDKGFWFDGDKHA